MTYQVNERQRKPGKRVLTHRKCKAKKKTQAAYSDRYLVDVIITGTVIQYLGNEHANNALTQI